MVSTRCTARGGVRWNSQHFKNCVSLSPRVENLIVKKVIKVSYLNYRESSVFQVFRDSYTYERFTHPWVLYICTFHILHFEYVTLSLGYSTLPLIRTL